MRGIFHRSHVIVRLTSLALLLTIVFICVVLVLHHLNSSTLSRYVGHKADSKQERKGTPDQERSKAKATSRWGGHREDTDWGKWRAGSRPGRSVPVYVLEEHHEAARYWIWAAQAGVLPRRSHNTLIHFDAHSDLAPPVIGPNFPLLRWPNLAAVSRLVNENDRFIQAVALTGLFSRMVWVYPTWTRKSIPVAIHSDATIWNITLGSWQRPVPVTKILHNSMNKSDKSDVAIDSEVIVEDMCWCVTPINPGKNWNQNMLGKFCLRLNSSEPNELPYLSAEGCSEKVDLMVESYTEVELLRQMKAGGLFQPLTAHQGFILDIDEDFFGCEPVAQSLYNVGINESHLQTLSFLIEKIFCGNTAEHEYLADSIFQKIIQFTIANRQICNRLSYNEFPTPDDVLRDTCVPGAYRTIMASLQKQQASTTSLFVDKVLCEFENDAFLKSVLYYLLGLLASLDDMQLKVVAEVGICFKTSLHTFEDDQAGHFRFCDGYNRPNETVVAFYSPEVKDVKESGQLLHRILGDLGNTPDVVTVCRSTRDGYTPRNRVRQIELTVLESLKRNSGNNIRIMYDRDLLGGKDGWWQRHGEGKEERST